MSRRKKREALTPELTPLIDVVFLLLIFFLVSTAFKKDELALLLQLPSSEQGAGSSDKKLEILTIELSAESIALNGKKLSMEEAEKSLAEAKKESQINLRVDGTVQYKRLVLILDSLQKNKLENVNLITEKKDEKN